MDKKHGLLRFLDDAFYNPTAISVLISSPDGSILDLQKTNIGYFKAIRDRWQERLGDAGAWTLEMKALFDRLYTVHDDYAIPNGTMIPQEEAARIALKEIPGGLSADQILYDLSYNSSARDENEQYIWMITFVSKGIKRFQVNLSAIDGTVLEVFTLYEDGGLEDCGLPGVIRLPGACVQKL